MSTGKSAKNSASIVKGKEFCAHSLDISGAETRLVFDCKECTLEASLKIRQCMAGVLKTLDANLNADSVILGDYAELRYTGPSMKMLKMLIKISAEMDNLSLRSPAREHFSEIQSQGARDKRVAACAACDSNPQAIFPELKKYLLEDIETFYASFVKVSRRVMANEMQECQACRRTTEESLVYIFGQAEELRAFLFYEGFRVLV